MLDGVGPLAWNAAADKEWAAFGGVPRWPAVHILAPLGTESLYVFPARAAVPTILASWPRMDRVGHAVRFFPGYRWIVIESPDTSATPATDSAGATPAPDETAPLKLLHFHAANGALLTEIRADGNPMPLGRNFLLWPQPSASDDVPPRLGVRRMPEGDDRAAWAAVTGWGAVSPLENFLAANTVGLLDPATGLRQDELRLMDLDGKVLWTRSAGADPREFSVSNFGDVAIARDRMLRVFDRSGAEKLRVALPKNVVGKTAISSDGRFVLVAARAPVASRAGKDLWVALFSTAKRTPLWTRRDLGAKGADVLELSVSDEGQRALLRLSTGPVALLGRDGATLALWNLERVSRGEYDAGVVPRRTWLSGDGALVALTTPVARSLAEARGWLYKISR